MCQSFHSFFCCINSLLRSWNISPVCYQHCSVSGLLADGFHVHRGFHAEPTIKSATDTGELLVKCRLQGVLFEDLLRPFTKTGNKEWMLKAKERSWSKWVLSPKWLNIRLHQLAADGRFRCCYLTGLLYVNLEGCPIIHIINSAQKESLHFQDMTWNHATGEEHACSLECVWCDVMKKKRQTPSWFVSLRP